MASIPDHSPMHPAAWPRRPGRWAIASVVAALVLAMLILAAGTPVVLHLWSDPPHRDLGTRHAVVMRRDQGLSDCSGNAEAWSGFEYGGVPWQPMGSFPASWGSTGPWAGVLTITGRTPARRPAPGHVVATGLFDYRGTQVPVFAGTGTRLTPLC